MSNNFSDKNQQSLQVYNMNRILNIKVIFDLFHLLF